MERKSRILKQKQQKTSKLVQKPMISDQKIYQEIDHQQSFTFQDNSCLLLQNIESLTIIELKGSRRLQHQDSDLIPYLLQNSEANDLHRNHESHYDVSGMSCNSKLLANQQLIKSDIVYDLNQNFFGSAFNPFIEQCDCKCSGSDELCQSCNCWPFCAQFKQQNSTGIMPEESRGNAFNLFDERRFNRDYKLVTCQEITFDGDESSFLISSLMVDEQSQRTHEQITFAQSKNKIKQEFDCFFNQSSSSHQHDIPKKISCRCKNKNCADARCVCRRMRGYCGPQCGCMHEECKNKREAYLIKFDPPRKSLNQAMEIEQEQNEEQEKLEEMKFVDFYYPKFEA